MKKKTMQRSFAMGGAIGGLTVDPLGNDFDAINAERTQRWAAEDAAKRAQYGGPTQAATSLTQPAAAAGLTISQTPQAAPAMPGVAPTVQNASSFQADSDARQARITSYSDRLRQMEANGRANSLMGSESSISRSFADGGAIRAETPDELMARISKQYGVPSAGGPVGQTPAQAQAAQQQAPQPVQQPKPAAVQGIFGILKNRGQQIDKAAGYRYGGKIRGPGTPLSDSIPAVVEGTGEPIRVANEERIVSKEQDDFLEELAQGIGYGSLDKLLEAGTGKPVGPTIKAGKRAAADGMQPAIYRPEMNGLSWMDKSFDPQKEQPAQGTGVIAIRTGQNAGKNIAIGPQQYTAADGTQTSDWSKTAQYAQGLAQAQRDRDALATMQRDRLERDAFSPEITDPHVQANARAQIAEQDAKAAKQGEAYGRMLDNQGKLVKLQGEGQMAGLQSQYLAETDPTRREALAERIRSVQGKGTAPGPVNLQHVETEQGIMAFNPKTARMEPIQGPDGQALKGGKALTEFQGKSTSYGMRANEASKIIDEVGQGGKVQPSLIKRAAEAVPLIGEGLGMAANKLQSAEQQQVEQGQRDFINAVLRQESGAAISASEFDNARKQYFPQPNDTPEVVAQKQRNREMAINGFRISAGPGAKNIGAAPAQQPQAVAAPKVGTVDGKHVFLGGNPADPASWAEVR